MARARKMALAYRATLQEQVRRTEDYRKALASINLQLVRFGGGQQAADEISKLLACDNPDPAGELDQRFHEWGEDWHAEIEASYEDDDMVTSKVAGRLIQVAPQTVNRLRVLGRIKGKWVTGQAPHWEYRVGDVYKLQSEMRGRGWRASDAIDTVPDSGRSDAE